MKVTVTPFKPEHLPPILDDIRPEDYREWYAGTGNADIQKGVQHVFDRGEDAWVALDEDGKALIVWGVSPIEVDTGTVWMFATSEAEKVALSLHRELRGEIPRLLQKWERLVAMADSRNLKHHQWLEWLGFNFIDEVYLAPFGLPFKHYSIRRP